MASALAQHITHSHSGIDEKRPTEKCVVLLFFGFRAEDAGLLAQMATEESMHLVEDNLKNPCLDYVKHVVFAPPNATFTAGGTTYAEFSAVSIYLRLPPFL